jgi:hypothetical protein
LSLCNTTIHREDAYTTTRLALWPAGAASAEALKCFYKRHLPAGYRKLDGRFYDIRAVVEASELIHRALDGPLRGSPGGPAIVRRFNHVKLVFGPRPRPAAKVYLYAGFGGGASVS